jgi:alpha-glucoside transport system substrate-binding protein
MSAHPKRFRYAMLAGVAALALVAAACGDDDDSGSADTTAAGSETTAGGTETSAGGGGTEDFSGKTITISGSETGTEAEGFIAGANAWAEKTGGTANFQGSRDFETQIRVAYESGTLPDVALFPQPGALAQYQDKAPAFPDDLLATLQENFDPIWTDLVTFDGKVSAVPLKADVKSLVWYSPKVFEEKGYTVPQTWDELMALQEQIKADGGTPWCIGIESGAATGWVFTDWMEDLMLRKYGPEVYDQWVSHELPFDSPEVRDVATMIGDIWFDDANVVGGRSSIVSTGFGAAPTQLVAGDCVLHRQGNFAAANILAEAPDAVFGPDGDFDAFYLPTISDEFGKVMLSGGNYAVAFNDKPETVSFMKHLAGPDFANARINADVGGFISPNKAQDTSLYSSDLDRQFAELLVTADVVRFDASDLMPGEVGSGSFWKEGTNYVAGSNTLDQFVENVDASWPSN